MSRPAVHYETYGDGSPLMLITGLGGVGRGWGNIVDRFAQDYLTIVPDHPGTGQSAPPPDGYTIAHHARAMADVLGELDCGPAHLVGSSTGGAIAQVMALDHRDVTKSIVLADSWARPDDYFRHQFAMRKRILAEQGVEAYTEASALFLFGAEYFRDHYDQVQAWIKLAGGADPAVMARRIDMIVAFDESARLNQIDVPTLVLVGDADICTPPHMSEDLARSIPGARLEILAGGHLIYKEAPDEFHDSVKAFTG
ncbi:MAG: alpha/beta fold hydrolase [Acidimicrobiia bacterium]|nr:alpha/beta fold hydrolase [Acidimicrobiia bacterium]